MDRMIWKMTLTFNVSDTASIDVQLKLVQDPDFDDVQYIHVDSITLLSTLDPTNANYQARIDQLSTIGGDYTVPGGATNNIFLDPSNTVNSGISYYALGSNGFDGQYFYDETLMNSRIGRQQVGAVDAVCKYRFTLQKSGVDVPETGVGVTYTFEITPGVNRTVDTKILADPNDPLLSNGGPTLYYRYDYATVYGSNPPNPLTLGTDTFGGGAGFAILRDTAQDTLVTAGNDFTLYLAQTDAGGNGLVNNVQQITVPYLEVDLMDGGMYLTKQDTAGSTGDYVFGTLRNSEVAVYSYRKWSRLNIQTVQETDGGLDIPVSDVISAIPDYVAAFTYQGSTFTASIITTSNGHKNVKLLCNAGITAAASTKFWSIKIRPGIATADIAAL